MKLKTKLIIVFFAITILPVAIMLTSFWTFTYLQMQEIQRYYGAEISGYEGLSNSVQILSRLTTDVYKSLEEAATNDPGSFEYKPFQNKINDKLLNQSSYLLVRKDGEIIFNGSDRDILYMQQLLPDFGSNISGAQGGRYISGEQCLIKGVDFYFEDGGRGSAFIVTDVNKMIPQFRQLFINMLIAIIVIMIITALLLMLWIYKSILIPINRLKKAAKNIKKGKLDFQIEYADKSEIGELCASFEDMRENLYLSKIEKQKYNQESRELIGNISHDLKTPITSIKGYVEGIRDGIADTPEKMERYIGTIYNKAIEMDRLIDELNVYSKIDTNRIPYNFHVINVSSYFNDCIEEVGMELSAKNVNLAYYDYTAKDIQVFADPEQIKRVVNNIISNSVKYMDKEKGFIIIRVHDVGDSVQIEIEDNGKGIAAKDLPMIFERFYRTDASRNSAQGGSGIGLSIVKKIIEDHKGRLWATSKEKKGTTIYFCLNKYKEEDNDNE